MHLVPFVCASAYVYIIMDASFLSDVKQHPVNSSHYSPYKNYLKQGSFTKRDIAHSTEDPFIRAQALLSDIHYSFGRVRKTYKKQGTERLSRMAPGPALATAKPPERHEDTPVRELEDSPALEKGFERVKARLPAIPRPSQSMSKSPPAVRHSSVPFLTSAEWEQLQQAYRSRLSALKSKLQKRITVQFTRANDNGIFPAAINSLRANTSLSSALEHE